MDDKYRETLIKQQYRIYKDHAAVKLCHWMKESMKSQNPCYQYNFAKYYLNGWGCKESKAKAFYWYIKSSNQGCQEAQKVVKEWVW